VRSSAFLTAYNERQRAVLVALLQKYVADGLKDLEESKVLGIAPLNQLGSTVEIVRRFGDKASYQAAVRSLITQLYVQE
jgi:type I restriction enzyme, R subunit